MFNKFLSNLGIAGAETARSVVKDIYSQYDRSKKSLTDAESAFERTKFVIKRDFDSAKNSAIKSARNTCARLTVITSKRESRIVNKYNIDMGTLETERDTVTHVLKVVENLESGSHNL